MTENEALKLMESLQISHDCEMVKTLDFQETVIRALETLQQYREIGTVKEIKIREAQFARLSEGYLKDLSLLREYQSLGTVEEIQKAIENLPLHQVEHKLLQEYQNIGTARECKVAVERMKPKKPIQQATTEKTHYKCPCCNNIMQTIYRDGVAWGHIANYCEWCGQKLDRE